MHGARGGAPKGNRNALKHGDFAAEGLALRRQISACRFPPRFDPGFPLRTDPAG